MIRRTALSLAMVLTASALAAGPSEPGRRRPVTNPHAIVDGVVAAVSPGWFRVQTASGSVNVALTPATEYDCASPGTIPAPGDYTLTEGLVARDGSVSARRVSLFTVPSSVASAETLRVEGKVVTVSAASSSLELETPGGTVVTVSANETTLIRRDGTTIALKEIEPGNFARVVGKPTGERTLLALEIHIRTADLPPHHDFIVGQVAEIRPQERNILINPRRDGPGPAVLETVHADANTEIYRRGERIRFDDIKLGDFVLANGTFDPYRVLLATRIDVAELPAPAPRIAGRVLEVSAARRTLSVAVERGWMPDAPAGPVTVIVNEDTRIYHLREQVRFDAIKQGDFVVVAGAWSEDKTLVATTIHIVPIPDLPPMPAILGEIVSIEPATRTLVVRVRAMRPLENSTDGTVEVLAGDETKIFRNGQPIRFGELAIGNIVLVLGTVRDDGTVLASRIDAIVLTDRPAQIMGYVSAVGAASIDIIVPSAIPTFAPIRATLLVDAMTEIFRDGSRIRLSDVKVNEMVFASGEWKGDDTMLARKIEVKNIPPPPGLANARGTIVEIDGSSLLLAAADGRWIVTATPMTLVIRPGGVPSTFRSLTAGEKIEVSGMAKSDHNLIAMKIEVLK